MEASSQGLQLELTPSAPSFAAYTLPILEASISNISEGPIRLCTYLAEHRLLSTLTASDGFEMYPFRPTVRKPMEETDYVELAPGAAFRVTLDLTKAARRGYWFVYAGSLPADVDESFSVLGFKPGEHRFRTYFGDIIQFYLPPPGLYRPGPVRYLSRENPNQCGWKGEMVATCLVRFDNGY